MALDIFMNQIPHWDFLGKIVSQKNFHAKDFINILHRISLTFHRSKMMRFHYRRQNMWQ